MNARIWSLHLDFIIVFMYKQARIL